MPKKNYTPEELKERADAERLEQQLELIKKTQFHLMRLLNSDDPAAQSQQIECLARALQVMVTTVQDLRQL